MLPNPCPLLLVGLLACVGPDQEPTVPPDARLVASTPVAEIQAVLLSSGMENRARSVIGDQAAWAAAWAELYRIYQPVPPVPTIDFGSATIILAAMGTRNSGGYVIAIEAVYRTADRFYVAVKETSPGRGCVTTQSLTAPVFAVKVARVDRPVSFVEQRVTIDCGS